MPSPPKPKVHGKGQNSNLNKLQDESDSESDDAEPEKEDSSTEDSDSSSFEPTMTKKRGNQRKRKARPLSSPSPSPSPTSSPTSTAADLSQNIKKLKMLPLKDVENIQGSSSSTTDPEEPAEDVIKDKKKSFTFKDKSSSYDLIQENADGLLSDLINFNEEPVDNNNDNDINTTTTTTTTTVQVKKENFDPEDSGQEIDNHQFSSDDDVQIIEVKVKVDQGQGQDSALKNQIEDHKFNRAQTTSISSTNNIKTEPGKMFNSTSNELNNDKDDDSKPFDPNNLEIGDFRGILVNDGVTGEFDGENFDHSGDLRKKLHNTFGHRDFRPIQLQAINGALLNHDCFILMASSGGKSLTFQLPALLSQGLTVVVTPSKGHIIDQVMKLDPLGVLVGYLSDDPNYEKQNNDILHVLEHNSSPILKLLYVTPGQLAQSAHLNHVLQVLYQRGLLTRFVIDEAHCVSPWGHDFRKEYSEFPSLKMNYRTVPITALTATANPATRSDLLSQLNIPHPKWFHCSLNRPNLKFEVRPKGVQNQALTELVLLLRSPQFINGSGIVFCSTRVECDMVASQLSRNGIMALSYHAGQEDKKRNQTHKDWRTNKVRIICSTTAFGVGIDKPDVRIVVHYFMPKSIENYYQETGRAGRDGLNAHCILFFSFNDVTILQKIIMGSKIINTIKKVMLESLARMVAYCQNDSDCRRVLQLEYFGENFNADRCRAHKSTACDNCSAEETYIVKDVTEISRQFVQAILDICGSAGESLIFNKKFTQSHFIEVFKGSMSKMVMISGHQKINLYGKGKSWIKRDIENLIKKLIAENYLSEESIASKEFSNVANNYLRCGPKGLDLLEGRDKLEMPISVVKMKKFANIAPRANIGNKNAKRSMPSLMSMSNPQGQGSSYSTINSAGNSNFEKEIGQIQVDAYRELVMECLKISNILGLPNWSSLVLREMCQKLPETFGDLVKLPGISMERFDAFGSKLLAITKKYAEVKRVKILQNQQQQIFGGVNIPSTSTATGNMSSIDDIVRNVGYQVASMNSQMQLPMNTTAAALAAQQTQAWLARGYNRRGGRRNNNSTRGGRGGRRGNSTINSATYTTAQEPQLQAKKSRKK